MTAQAVETVSVQARFQVQFELPPGVVSLEVRPMFQREDRNQHELSLIVVGETVEETQAALQGLRERLVQVLQGQVG